MEIKTVEQWESAVDHVNKHIYKIDGRTEQEKSNKRIELLIDEGLLKIRNDSAGSNGQTYGDTVYRLVGCNGTAIIPSFIDPFQLWFGMKKLVEKAPENFCGELLYGGRSSKRVRADLNVGGYGVFKLTALKISKADQRNLFKLQMFMQRWGIDDINTLDDEDKRILGMALADKDEALSIKKVEECIKLYSDTRSTISIDAPIDSASGDSGTELVDLIPSPSDDIPAVYEDDDFIERLSKFKTALSNGSDQGKSVNSRKTLRLFLTRLFTYDLVDTEHIFNVSNYAESKQLLAWSANDSTEAEYMLNAKQTYQENAAIIDVNQDNLKACCNEPALFDTLITCCLFARGHIDMIGGKFNDDKYHEFLVATYAEAGRSTYGLSAVRRKDAKTSFYDAAGKVLGFHGNYE